MFKTFLILSVILFANILYAFSFRFNFLRTPLPTTGLIFYLTNDTTTNPIDSVSQTPLSLTYTGSLTTGVLNGAIQLQGMSGMTIPLQTVYSACTWAKFPTNFWTIGGIGYIGIGRYSGNVAYNGNKWYRFGPFGYHSGVAQVTDDSQTSSVYTPMIYVDNAWHHYCSILNTSALTVKTYRDGILVNSVSGLQRWNYYGTALNLINEIVDITPASVTPVMDEFRIYNKALSMSEIQTLRFQTLYNGGIVTNGDFSDGTNSWTGSLGSVLNDGTSTGDVKVTQGFTGTNYFRQNIPTTNGKTYTVQFKVNSVSPSNGTCGSHVVDSSQDPRDGTKLGSNVNINSAGTYSYTFTAISSTSTIVLAAETVAGAVCSFDNVNVH